MKYYYFKHKDDTCGIIAIDENSGDFRNIKIQEPELMPFLGQANEERMRIWWKTRAVPSSRKTTMEIIRRSGCKTSEEYLAKNLALSLTDCYWICPIDMDLLWDDVKLWNLVNQGVLHVPYHNATSYDPNATLGGQMDKYWDLSNEDPVLVKTCASYFGQQAINEAFATWVQKKQETNIPYVSYRAIRENDIYRTVCKAFTTENIELVTAYEVICSEKQSNDKSNYNAFVDICKKHGLEKEITEEYLDFELELDFSISNTDRHLMNLGILRNADTLTFLGVAPIYDNGNSMFFRDPVPYNRATILQRDITSLCKKEETILKQINNRSALNAELLPSESEVKTFYEKTKMPEQRINVIAHNYGVKLELLKDFQKGKTISYYFENKNLKKPSVTTSIDLCQPKHFILLSGIPGSGKSKQAELEMDLLKRNGMLYCASSDIYKGDSNEDMLFFDKESIIQEAIVRNRDIDKTNSYTLISINDIREEFPQSSEEYVFTVAFARMEGALSCGCSVIYDAGNLDEYDRNKSYQIAEKYNVEEKTIVLCKCSVEESKNINQDITESTIQTMLDRFNDANENISGNWKIKEVLSPDLKKAQTQNSSYDQKSHDDDIII